MSSPRAVRHVLLAGLLAGLLAAAGLAAAAPAVTGPPHLPAPAAAPVLDSLVGSWAGEGTLLGRPAAFRMTWTAAVVPGVYALDFANAFLAADGSRTPVLSARALYRVGPDGAVEGVWFDSRGVRIELAGRADPDRLRIDWTAPSESGVTVYRWPGDGTAVVVDSVQGAEGMREFGRARYRRSLRP